MVKHKIMHSHCWKYKTKGFITISLSSNFAMMYKNTYKSYVYLIDFFADDNNVPVHLWFLHFSCLQRCHLKMLFGLPTFVMKWTSYTTSFHSLIRWDHTLAFFLTPLISQGRSLGTWSTSSNEALIPNILWKKDK